MSQREFENLILGVAFIGFCGGMGVAAVIFGLAILLGAP